MPGLGLDLPEEPAKPAAASPYRVLARKYRPQSFAELIGQDAMVKTLANAIEKAPASTDRRVAIETLLRLSSPMVPHLAEEMQA